MPLLVSQKEPVPYWPAELRLQKSLDWGKGHELVLTLTSLNSPFPLQGRSLQATGNLKIAGISVWVLEWFPGLPNTTEHGKSTWVEKPVGRELQRTCSRGHTVWHCVGPNKPGLGNTILSVPADFDKCIFWKSNRLTASGSSERMWGKGHPAFFSVSCLGSWVCHPSGLFLHHH